MKTSLYWNAINLITTKIIRLLNNIRYIIDYSEIMIIRLFFQILVQIFFKI